MSRASGAPHPRSAALGLGAALAVVACSDPGTPQPLPAAPRGDERAAPSTPGPRDLFNEPIRDESEPPPPRLCPLVGCFGGFSLQLEREGPWPAGTYYFRVSVNDGPRQVCSVVFEPVIGAARDTCNEAGLPFSVSYRYDDEVQQIFALEFGELRRVHVTLLLAEDEPPLADVEHDVDWKYASSTGECSTTCGGAAPLVVEVARAAVLGGDAGDLSDAGDATDAGSAVDDAGATGAAP